MLEVILVFSLLVNVAIISIMVMMNHLNKRYERYRIKGEENEKIRDSLHTLETSEHHDYY